MTPPRISRVWLVGAGVGAGVEFAFTAANWLIIRVIDV